MTLNISFFSAFGELVVCAKVSGVVLNIDVAITPSNDTDRNAKMSSFCLVLVLVVDNIDEQKIEYISAQISSFIRR